MAMARRSTCGRSLAERLIYVYPHGGKECARPFDVRQIAALSFIGNFRKFALAQ
jgi:hypothetical protein